MDLTGRGVATPPAFPGAGKEEAMDKQEAAPRADGVVLSFNLRMIATESSRVTLAVRA